MKLFLSATLLLSSAIQATNSVADVPAEQKPEVDHLISFVSTTECKLKRNFSYHSGKKAITHIQKKYDHFRDEINTTEDFIRLSASKSLLTGRAYQVKCGDNDLIGSSTWLSAELKAYRKREANTQAESAGELAVIEQATKETTEHVSASASTPDAVHTPKILITKFD